MFRFCFVQSWGVTEVLSPGLMKGTRGLRSVHEALIDCSIDVHICFLQDNLYTRFYELNLTL